MTSQRLWLNIMTLFIAVSVLLTFAVEHKFRTGTVSQSVFLFSPKEKLIAIELDGQPMEEKHLATWSKATVLDSENAKLRPENGTWQSLTFKFKNNDTEKLLWIELTEQPTKIFDPQLNILYQVKLP